MPIFESLYTLQPDVVDLLFIKLWFMLGQTVQVWKIKGLNAIADWKDILIYRKDLWSLHNSFGEDVVLIAYLNWETSGEVKLLK